jgi:hypothetical protein
MPTYCGRVNTVHRKHHDYLVLFFFFGGSDPGQMRILGIFGSI